MEFKFSEENLNRLNKEISKYPDKQSAVMAALWIAQEQNGWISGEVMKEVAIFLEMTPEAVLGIVTFYSMYHREQPGEYHLQVCTNISCMLRGGTELFDYIRRKIGSETEMKGNGKFSLEEVECMGSCGTAPMMAINEEYFENLNKEKIDQLLNSLMAK